MTGTNIEFLKQNLSKLIFTSHFMEPWKMSEGELDDFCQNVPLTETYMREFKDYLIWDILSDNQRMSNKFIEEFKDKVNWNLILAKKDCTEEFIDEHAYLLPTDKAKNSIKNEITWSSIFQNSIRSKKFFMKYYEHLNWKEIFTFDTIIGGQIINEYKDYIEELQLYKKYINQQKWNRLKVAPYIQLNHGDKLNPKLITSINYVTPNQFGYWRGIFGDDWNIDEY